MRQPITLGLKENWKQFSLLLIVNAFVGGMIGLERAVLPQIAEQEFAIVAKTAILSFIAVFGVSKALTNYYTGVLANIYGRKKLLIAGWVIAIPIPLVLMWADNWYWIIAVNALLGIHQGLTWSSTVVMKIDLVGEKQRGFAMGLNEFTGYLSVALVAFLTAWISDEYGLRPYPFYLGIVFILFGLLLSVIWIKDTRHHVEHETGQSALPRLRHIFWDTTWRNPRLGAVSQAGLVNNLNDGLVWGFFPILLTSKGFSLHQTGVIVAVYPAVWGIGQLFTGTMADIFPKKKLLYWGMLIQALALMALPEANTYIHFIALSLVLGWGTAMVYPTFLATVAENTHPSDRAESLGVFRLWRDLGYAVGAVLTGLVADKAGIDLSIWMVGALTMLSAFIIIIRYT